MKGIIHQKLARESCEFEFKDGPSLSACRAAAMSFEEEKVSVVEPWFRKGRFKVYISHDGDEKYCLCEVRPKVSRQSNSSTLGTLGALFHPSLLCVVFFFWGVMGGSVWGGGIPCRLDASGISFYDHGCL